MYILIFISIIIATAFLTLSILGSFRPRIIMPVREEDKFKAEKQAINMRGIFKILGPISAKILEKLKLDTMLKNQLGAAHVKLTPPEFFSIKILLIPFFIVLGVITTQKLDPAVLAVTLVLAYIIPDMILRKKITQRKNDIARILPETIDLLSLCVEAGLDFTSAVRWIIEKTPVNPMVEELGFVLEEIRWGKPRTQALKDMGKD